MTKADKFRETSDAIERILEDDDVVIRGTTTQGNRIYLGHGKKARPRLVEPDGETVYDGRIREVFVKPQQSELMRFQRSTRPEEITKVKFYVTDDGRWFDNAGMPCDPPPGYEKTPEEA